MPAPQAAPAQPSFAEKLSAAAAAASANEPEQPAPIAGMSAALPVGYQQAPPAPEPSTTDITANAWGSKTADIQTASLAGLLSGKTEEDKSSSVLQMPPGMSTSTAADSLSLQFGQFGMGGAGIGDFGAGFGSGFGDDLGTVDTQVPGPARSAVHPLRVTLSIRLSMIRPRPALALLLKYTNSLPLAVPVSFSTTSPACLKSSGRVLARTPAAGC